MRFEKESGRYEDYGEEMLRITDRQNREMLYDQPMRSKLLKFLDLQ